MKNFSILAIISIFVSLNAYAGTYFCDCQCDRYEGSHYTNRKLYCSQSVYRYNSEHKRELVEVLSQEFKIWVGATGDQDEIRGELKKCRRTLLADQPACTTLQTVIKN